MKKLTRSWHRLSAKKQAAIHLLTVVVLVWFIYVLLGCPAITAKGAFRRAEKAAMVGPATVIGQFRPAGYDCDAIVLGQDPEAVYLFVMNRWNPSASQMIYRQKEDNVTVLAAPGKILYQYEMQARIPMVLFHSCKEAARAELELNLRTDTFEKTYRLSATREAEGYFHFPLEIRAAGSLGAEGEALRLLQEVCSNSMAGNADIAFPAAVRLYDASGALILEETTCIRSAAAQTHPLWPGYSGTMEDYVYRHTDERDRKWEEDILYLAERFLETHPILADKEIMHPHLVIDPETFRCEYKYEYSDKFYDESTKNSFVDLVNALIPQIPQLSDSEITYELRRILTTLGDAHVGINDWGTYDCFPIDFEAIYEGDDPSYYAVRVSQGFEYLLLGKLTAINGVPIDDIVNRFRAYQPCENEYWLINRLANSYCWGCFLTQIDALQKIGVTEPNATDAVFTFETENGTLDQVIQAISFEAYETAYLAKEFATHPMLDEFAYNARKGNYWYDLINDGNTMYIRFYKMYEDPEYLLNDYLAEIQKIIRESEEPLQIVFDFRNNGGGKTFLDEFNRLITEINKATTNGVYILINNGSYSAGNIIPYRLCQSISGAQLVGTPTGQSINTFGNPLYYTLPNHGYEFSVPSAYHHSANEVTQDTQYPDIWIEQTLEYYQNGVDAVMDYVLSLE